VSLGLRQATTALVANLGPGGGCGEPPPPGFDPVLKEEDFNVPCCGGFHCYSLALWLRSRYFLARSQPPLTMSHDRESRVIAGTAARPRLATLQGWIRKWDRSGNSPMRCGGAAIQGIEPKTRRGREPSSASTPAPSWLGARGDGRAPLLHRVTRERRATEEPQKIGAAAS
jgi:hypothetical protein